MAQKIFILALCLFTLGACSKKDDDNSNNGNGNTSQTADNTFKVTKGGGAGTVDVTVSNIVCGTENSSQGTFYSFRGFFSVGSNSTYDRLAIGFKSEPDAAPYPVTFQQYYANLPADMAGVNITYDSYNYIVNSGSVTVSVVNGRKKAVFDNLVLESGAAIPGTSGTKLPDGSSIGGSLVCQ